MRHIQRSTTAVLLTLVLALPAAAASRPSRSTGIVKAMQRFVILVTSRISPPGSVPVLADESIITTTDAPAKTQQQH